MHKNTKKILVLISLLPVSVLFFLLVNYSIRTGTVVSIKLITANVNDDPLSFYFGVLALLTFGISLIKAIIDVVKGNV